MIGGQFFLFAGIANALNLVYDRKNHQERSRHGYEDSREVEGKIVAAGDVVQPTCKYSWW